MTDKKTNILIVISDQHHADYLGSVMPDLHTPNIDRLARFGVNYRNTYCANPLCVPSRMSFMTGMSTQTLEVWSLNDTIRPDLATWPVKLRGLGYETVMSGRMHAVWGNRMLGFEKRLCGDDNFYLTKGSTRQVWDRPEVKNVGPQEIHTNYGPDGCYTDKQNDIDAVENALNFLNAWDAEKDRPFALCVGLFQPHAPFTGDNKFYELYRDMPVNVETLDEKLPNFLRIHAENRGYARPIPEENYKLAVRSYCSMVSQVDEYVGRMTAVLEAEKQFENTLVVYVSDHGEMLGQRGMWHKQCLLDGSVKAPLVVKYPRGIGPEAGTIETGPVSLLDIYPTLTELANGEPDVFYEGRSLLRKPDPDRVIFAEYADFGLQAPRAMVRKGNFKLIAARGFKSVLFDLARDPDERVNLVDVPDMHAVRSELEAELAKRWDPDATFEKVLRNQKNIDLWHKAIYKE